MLNLYLINIQVLKKIINEIRFFAMTPEEFKSSSLLSLSGIISENEWVAIYQNINYPDSNWPKPINLSSSRESRQSSLSSGSSQIQCLRLVRNYSVVLLEPSTDLKVSLTVDEDVMITGIVIAPIFKCVNYATLCHYSFLNIIFFYSAQKGLVTKIYNSSATCIKQRIH